MEYFTRIIEQSLNECVLGIPAVAIVGAKGIGKTSTAKRIVKTVLELDTSEPSRVLAASISGMRTISDYPILIDEWSRVPQSWDVVRRLVDENYSPGQFILTGSASQLNLNIHSGAGRIYQLVMRPLSMQERGLGGAPVFLKDILDGKLDENMHVLCSHTIMDYLHEILVSGFPAIRTLTEKFAMRQIDGYLSDIISKEFAELGVKVRKPKVMLAWMKAYAAATGTSTSYNKIMNAATAGEDAKPSSNTTLVYRDLLDALFITDRVDPWLPTDNCFSTLGKAQKHYMVDPALVVRLLGLDAAKLMADDVKPLGKQRESSMLGRLFEALVAQSLKVYCQALDADLSHLRTSAGDHEVDFIITKGNVVIGAEVKLSAEVNRDDVSQLHWLGSKLAPAIRYEKVLINTGSHAYRRVDGVLVVPLGLLACGAVH